MVIWVPLPLVMKHDSAQRTFVVVKVDVLESIPVPILPLAFDLVSPRIRVVFDVDVMAFSVLTLLGGQCTVSPCVAGSVVSPCGATSNPNRFSSLISLKTIARFPDGFFCITAVCI